MLIAPGYLFAFNRPSKKASGGGSDKDGGAMSGKSGGATNNSRLRRWRLKSISPGLRWKRLFNLHLWFVDSVLFKIVSVFEAVVLISTLAFFYLFCGCHI